MLPRVNSEHTSAFAKPKKHAGASGRKRKLRPFLDSMDGSKTASTSVVASLTSLGNGLQREPVLYDSIVIPKIRAVPTAVGAIAVIKRCLAPTVSWIKAVLQSMRNRGIDPMPVLLELWRRTLPAAMVEQSEFTSDPSRKRFGESAW